MNNQFFRSCYIVTANGQRSGIHTSVQNAYRFLFDSLPEADKSRVAVYTTAWRNIKRYGRFEYLSLNLRVYTIEVEQIARYKTSKNSGNVTGSAGEQPARIPDAVGQ